MIGWILVLAACAAPWAFGASDPSFAAALSAVCLVPAALGFLTSAVRRPDPLPVPRAWTWLCILLPVPALLALVPLPPAVASILAPGVAERAMLGGEAGGGDTGWRPLSGLPAQSLAAAALAATYASALWWCVRAGRRTWSRIGMGAAVALVGTALAIFGLYQNATQTDPPTIYWRFPIYEVATPYGPFVNRNHFAGAMEITGAVTLGLLGAAVVARRWIFAGLAGIAAVTQAVALLGSNSRGGMIGAAAGIAFLAVAAVAGEPAPATGGASAAEARRRKLKILLLLAAGAVVVAGVLHALGLLDGLVARLTQGTGGRQGNRFLVQRDALGAFADQPLVGAGAGTFATTFMPWQRLNDLRSFENAHSDWAQILMETGLLGAGIAGIGVAALLVVRKRAAALTGFRRWEALGALAACVAVAVHGLFEVNLRVPSNALLLAVAASLGCAATLSAEPAAENTGDPPSGPSL